MRSYKDLPLRFHEQTPLHRNEASGVLSGLTRVRQFSQDDGHCFVTEEQIAAEVEMLLGLIRRVYGDFGLEYTAKLSTRPESNFIGEVAIWDRAEAALKQALERAGQPYTINAGDGAFYGPKIDCDITDAIGRKWQCATIQLDYNIPQRFDLKYIGADNAEHRPVVIHRAIFGSIERFIAILIEHFAGAFPLWMAPVQAVVLPIADRHVEYARQVQGAAGGGRPAGRASTRGRRRSTTRSARPSSRRCPTCWSSATARRPTARWRCGAAPKATSERARLTQFVADALAEIAAKTVS